MDLLTIFRFFSPVRIVEIIILLSLIPIFNFEWKSATMIFNYFFPIIGISIVFEAFFDKDGFRKGLKNVEGKYLSGIGIQFLGVAIFALSSFNTDPEKTPTIIGYSLLVLGIGGCLEAFHIVSQKKLRNIKLSPIQEVLAVIGFVVMLVFFGLYAVSRLNLQG